VAHTCLEAGFKYQRPNENIHLVVVHVASETQLLSAVERIGAQGIQFTVFHEPDDEMGYTAACTEPVSPVYRREFRNFPLWEASREVIEI
jgi:hypothetical protein